MCDINPLFFNFHLPKRVVVKHLRLSNFSRWGFKCLMRGTFYTRLELGVVEPQNWNLFELCTQTAATVDDQGQNSFGETIPGTQLIRAKYKNMEWSAN